jgi:hypothetical protein
MSTSTQRPAPSEYKSEFGQYISLVPDGDLVAIFQFQLDDAAKMLGGVTEPQSQIRHAPYTWSVKQVVGHITDCERVFVHRVLWIARGNTTPLAGFQENEFMQYAEFDTCPFAGLREEFLLIRKANLHLFRHLPPQAWSRQGTVKDHPMSVRAMAYIAAGHAKHHLDILHKRLGR